MHFFISLKNYSNKTTTTAVCLYPLTNFKNRRFIYNTTWMSQTSCKNAKQHGTTILNMLKSKTMQKH